MTMKITAAHLERRAFVYLRQSTPDQVREHSESTTRQYALAERAQTLGWRPEQVRVLDGDLGKSGKTAEGRDDFHQVCASVGLGEVGAVFALEASRLSRSQADWHRLLELCAWTHTLLVDHDGIYDPNDFNDRVLLGFKGTWSHTELHSMRMRLNGARKNKASRGELRVSPPTGYVYDEDGALVFDPDEGVVAAVRRVFDLFRSLGSAYAVARHFAAEGARFPTRRWVGGSTLGPLEWRPLRATRVGSILSSPIYAGTYVYGRRPARPVLRDGKLVRMRQVTLPRGEWEVELAGAHMGYVTAEEHEENQRMLTMNRTTIETGERQGRPREGAALLPGLILCGRCGRRMQVRYRDDGHSYFCARSDNDTSNTGASRCWSTPGARVDAAIERHVLAQLTEENLDLSLEVLRRLEADEGETERQWQLRLERARQEAARAERQYNLVEPENRLVARTVERRWEEKLADLAELEERYAEALAKPRLSLTTEERARILQLARDLPAVWRAPTTRNEERKELLGLLVQQIALVPEDLPRRQTRAKLLWHGGKVTEATAERPDKYTQFSTSSAILGEIAHLMADHTDEEIAAILNARGSRTGRNKTWTRQAVISARQNHDLPRPGKDSRRASTLEARADGRYSAVAVARTVGVCRQTVHAWREAGILDGVVDPGGRTWWFTLSEEQIAELRKRPQVRGRFERKTVVIDNEVQCG